MRYEDSEACPSSPFAVGITVENISAQTTNDSWVSCRLGGCVQCVQGFIVGDRGRSNRPLPMVESPTPTHTHSGFLSGNVSRGGKFSHEEYVGGKSKAL